MPGESRFSVESNRWTPAQDLEQALIYRGVIVAAWAQVDGVLSDLLVRCREVPAYAADLAAGVPRVREQRVAKLKALLAVPGPLQRAAEPIRELLRDGAKADAIRHLMAHGRMRVLSNWGAEFRGWQYAKGVLTSREHVRLTLDALEAEAVHWAAFSTRVDRLFYTGARRLGLPPIVEPIVLPSWLHAAAGSQEGEAPAGEEPEG